MDTPPGLGSPGLRETQPYLEVVHVELPLKKPSWMVPMEIHLLSPSLEELAPSLTVVRGVIMSGLGSVPPV